MQKCFYIKNVILYKPFKERALNFRNVDSLWAVFLLDNKMVVSLYKPPFHLFDGISAAAIINFFYIAFILTYKSLCKLFYCT